MAVLFIVLKWLGIILLCLLAVLILLLIFPVWVHVEYNCGKFMVKLQVLFLRFKLYPAKSKTVKQLEKDAEKEAKKAAKKAEADAEKGQEPATPKPKRKITPDVILDIVETAGWAMKKLFKALKIRNIIFIMPVHGEDAADTAEKYGKMNAYMGGTVAALQNFLNMKFTGLKLIPDFTDEFKDKSYISCKVGILPIVIIAVCIYGFIQLKNRKVI
ncbi:MAG: DUF2953 domain-containing protein [Oscillospiraceae bacterium]|nr:DUF2953 domain-containing protein [Oscillospiraceae bacterium]